MAYFRKYRDSRGEWRWTYHAANGEAIAVSSEGYVREADCAYAINLVKIHAPNADVRP